MSVLKICSAIDTVFFRRFALDYLEQGDVDHSIPSDGHIDGAARWSPEPEIKNQYASDEEHERLRDRGFSRPEDENGSYMKWHSGDEADVHRIKHIIWPHPDGTWEHIRHDANYSWPDHWLATTHPDLSVALGEYEKYRVAQPGRYGD